MTGFDTLHSRPSPEERERDREQQRSRGGDEPRRRPAAPGSPWRLVAIPAAIAVGAIGALAAEHVGLPPVVGALVGALAAVLAVLALPSMPTRRATVLLLGAGGLAALRQAAFPGATSSLMLLLWAFGTLVALLLVDRADAEEAKPLPGGAPFRGRLAESVRSAVWLGAIVAVAAVVLVPTVTDHLGRHVWPGLTPGIDDAIDAPPSLTSSQQLDMTTRPRLSDKVVFTVDASRAAFWRGETFDEWNGQVWSRSSGRPQLLERDQNGDVPLELDPYDDGARQGTESRQTFRIEARYSNVVFAAPSPVRVETDKVLGGRSDGTAVVAPSGIEGFGKGAVYTVTSRTFLATADDLRATASTEIPPAVLAQYAQTPASTPQRVRDLAEQVTANARTNYDKIQAIEDWLGANTKYSLDAPLSPRNVDVVDDFLFRSRLGWCEQVASSLVVLARSVGIPARLATGFVPGERDHLTGRFVVRERDAHAWAEIYFPGIGWQGFDPTAQVPLAGDAHPGGSWFDAARHHALEIGILAGVLLLTIVAGPELLNRRRRRAAERRASWSTQTLARLERLGTKAGRPRAPAETPREYAHALVPVLGDARLDDVGTALDRDAYSARGAPPDDRASAEAVLTSLSS